MEFKVVRGDWWRLVLTTIAFLSVMWVFAAAPLQHFGSTRFHPVEAFACLVIGCANYVLRSWTKKPAHLVVANFTLVFAVSCIMLLRDSMSHALLTFGGHVLVSLISMAILWPRKRVAVHSPTLKTSRAIVVSVLSLSLLSLSYAGSLAITKIISGVGPVVFAQVSFAATLFLAAILLESHVPKAERGEGQRSHDLKRCRPWIWLISGLTFFNTTVSLVTSHFDAIAQKETLTRQNSSLMTKGSELQNHIDQVRAGQSGLSDIDVEMTYSVPKEFAFAEVFNGMFPHTGMRFSDVDLVKEDLKWLPEAISLSRGALSHGVGYSPHLLTITAVDSTVNSCTITPNTLHASLMTQVHGYIGEEVVFRTQWTGLSFEIKPLQETPFNFDGIRHVIIGFDPVFYFGESSKKWPKRSMYLNSLLIELQTTAHRRHSLTAYSLEPEQDADRGYFDVRDSENSYQIGTYNGKCPEAAPYELPPRLSEVRSLAAMYALPERHIGGDGRAGSEGEAEYAITGSLARQAAAKNLIRPGWTPGRNGFAVQASRKLPRVAAPPARQLAIAPGN